MYFSLPIIHFLLIIPVIESAFGGNPTFQSFGGKRSVGSEIEISPDQTMVAVGYTNGFFRLFSIDGKKICENISTVDSQIIDLVWLPTSGPVTLDDQNNVILWSQDCEIVNKIDFDQTAVGISWDQIQEDNDADNDGIPDNLDNDDDFDYDGIPDDIDTDDDNDGIPDSTDTDGDNDGIPDNIDTDDDNDGIPDVEDDNDNDNDGITDDLDTDDDNDGIPDNLDDDDDGDGIPDDIDPDDDNDGIPDTLDDDGDADNDGIPDATDPDDDNDGIPDTTDTDDDGDGVPDTKDDADNDNDGIPNSIDDDDDNDGIPDTIDTDDDGDGIPDVTDTDDDNDGIPDSQQASDYDNDNDGVPDTLDKDDDNDGIPDDIDTDDDGDGIPDDEDEDDDNDEIPDILQDSTVCLIAVNFEDRIEEYDVETGEHRETYDFPNGEVALETLFFDKDEEDGSTDIVLMVSTDIGKIRMFDTDTGNQVGSFDVPDPVDIMEEIQFTTGDKIIGSTEANTILEFDSGGNVEERGDFPESDSLSICPTTSSFALGHTQTKTIGVYSRTGPLEQVINSLVGFSEDVDCSEKYLVSVDEVGNINVYTYAEEATSNIKTIAIVCGVLGGVLLLTGGVVAFIKLKGTSMFQQSAPKYADNKSSKFPKPQNPRPKPQSNSHFKLSNMQTTMRE